MASSACHPARSMTALPRPDRAVALREAFRHAESLGPIRPAAVGLAAGLIASYVADGLLAPILSAPWRQLADSAVFVAVMAPLWLLVQPASVRRAHDVLTWLNGWETERWQAELGRRLTAVPRATPAMVDALPDTMGLRPLRIELLAVNGRLDEARERLALLPVDTPWQRFERAALSEWVAWWGDEPERTAAMRKAAADIHDEERGLAAGLIASYVADGLLAPILSAPWRQLADSAVFVAVMAPIWLAVQPASVRRAHDVLTWLNGWETERWQAELGRRLTAVPRATPAMVDALPDTLGLRPLRIELLAANGRLDEARERLALLPADTPWQRFERAALSEWVAWWGDEPERTAAMRKAAADIHDEERSLAARVMTAAAEARRAATSGGDAMRPLAELRDALGERPRRYAFSYTAGILVMVALMGIVAGITVSVAAGVIR